MGKWRKKSLRSFEWAETTWAEAITSSAVCRPKRRSSKLQASAWEVGGFGGVRSTSDLPANPLNQARSESRVHKGNKGY